MLCIDALYVYLYSSKDKSIQFAILVTYKYVFHLAYSIILEYADTRASSN